MSRKMNMVEYASHKMDLSRNLLQLNGYTRSDMGFARSKAMVKNAYSNYQDLYGNVDFVNHAVKRFSAQSKSNKVKRNAGMTSVPAFSQGAQQPSFNNTSTSRGTSSVQNLQTISAVDITIDMLIYSFLPWLAIERELTTSTEAISFKKIISLNEAGGVNKGDTLIGQFSPENTNLDLNTPVKEMEVTGDGSSKATISFKNQIFAGTCLVKYTPNGQSEIIARDLDGIILIPKVSTEFIVDYETGTFVSKENLPTGDKVVIQVMLDSTADPEGTHILRTTTKMDKVDLITRPTSVVIEDSNDKLLYVMKAIKAADGGVSMEEYLAQMLYDVYVAFVNNMLMAELHKRYLKVYNTSDLVTRDLAAYAGQIIADPSRKYDELAALIQDMDSLMLEKTNLSGTVLVVGSTVAKIMATDTQRFVKSDTFKSQMNTLIGSYDGMPVLRHQYIDKNIDYKDPDGYGHIFIVYKDPDGEVGYLAYGEFLPIHTSENIYNFNNPLQFAKALSAQPGVVVINEDLCIVGRIRLNKKIR